MVPECGTWCSTVRSLGEQRSHADDAWQRVGWSGAGAGWQSRSTSCIVWKRRPVAGYSNSSQGGDLSQSRPGGTSVASTGRTLAAHAHPTQPPCCHRPPAPPWNQAHAPPSASTKSGLAAPRHWSLPRGQDSPCRPPPVRPDRTSRLPTMCAAMHSICRIERETRTWWGPARSFACRCKYSGLIL